MLILSNPGLITLAGVIPFSHTHLRLVGGAVRDSILNNNPVDLDFSTTYLPEIIISFLKKSSISFGTMGLNFGTVSAFIQGQKYDITTCRSDVSTNGRWATVTYTDQWEEDALRRDFTFNALYMTMTGSIIDYHHGMTDLHKGNVRFIGDPWQRLQEDRLRLLRYYRFWMGYGRETLDDSLIPLFQKCAVHLDILSPDRVRHELLKILEAPNLKWPPLYHHMTASNIWLGLFNTQNINTSLVLKTASPLARLWALTYTNEAACIKRLNLSRHQQKYIKSLAKAYAQPLACAFAILDEYGSDILNDWAILHDKNRAHMPASLPLFPLKASDLMACGISGPALGQALLCTRTWWRNQGGVPNKQACLEYARHEILSKSIL